MTAPTTEKLPDGTWRFFGRRWSVKKFTDWRPNATTDLRFKWVCQALETPFAYGVLAEGDTERQAVACVVARVLRLAGMGSKGASWLIAHQDDDI